MMNPAEIKHICIHGHFYQPSRENPWLDEIEREESAAPCHDWNERINQECYRANTAARLVDDKNRILRLNNNYQSLSFNFGPTLLRWMERNDPWVYKTIIGADRESCERFSGHGNAIAQVYNHIIMPLANDRDKVTQVLWGIRDFEFRFGRKPEGMWLAETAVDRKTLAIMAEAGIKFTILSPNQANRWRFMDETSAWQDVRGGGIPTGRPYRYDCGGGKFIHLFFYDGELARGIAFERILEHSSRMLGQIDVAFERRDRSRDEPWLVHTATDGESYGHHFKFGDMALAAVLRDLKQDRNTRIINYAAYLASFPVKAEVEIVENTAWSCAHGLGRWQSDCGCHIGGEPGWSQKWRSPLREAIDQLRDSLAAHYEQEMTQLVKDPWKTRDEYIEVLLDPESLKKDFVRRNLAAGVNRDQSQRLLKLLEMQRSAMYMYTSCGWFFDEISSLESRIILRHAARAIQLAEQTGSAPPEPAFLKVLERAPSNLPEYRNGATVYTRKIKPQVVEKDRVAANYAIQSLARSSQRQFHIYSHDIIPRQEESLGAVPVPCLFGHIQVKEDATLETNDFFYAVIHFGGLNFRCSVKPFTDQREYNAILRALRKAIEEQDTVKMIRILDGSFGPTYFSLHNVFVDLRAFIALEISQKALGAYTDFQRHLYQLYGPLLASFKQWGIRVPDDLTAAARRVLSDEADQLVREILAHEEEQALAQPAQRKSWNTTDFFYRAHTGRLHSILEDARSWHVSPLLPKASDALGKALIDALSALKNNFSPKQAGRLYRLVNVCQILEIKPQLWKLQTLYHKLVKKGLERPDLPARLSNYQGLVTELDRFLECRFTLLMEVPAISASRDIVTKDEGSTAMEVYSSTHPVPGPLSTSDSEAKE